MCKLWADENFSGQWLHEQDLVDAASWPCEALPVFLCTQHFIQADPQPEVTNGAVTVARILTGSHVFSKMTFGISQLFIFF